jgi:hypothetical protein
MLQVTDAAVSVLKNEILCEGEPVISSNVSSSSRSRNWKSRPKSSFGHAVDAAEVAPVGERDPQVPERPA